MTVVQHLSPWRRFRVSSRLIVCVLSIAVVALLGSSIGSSEPPALDRAVLDGLTNGVPAPLGAVLRWIYQLSGVHFTAVLVLASIVYLAIKRSWRELTALVVATSGILLIVDQWLKPFFDRSRPTGKLLSVDGHSFPSGHAAGSVVFYFLMCEILSARYPRWRVPLYVGSLGWVSLVWLSSLYCRVHWFTDIAAGACVGFVWLSLCLLWLRPQQAD